MLREEFDRQVENLLQKGYPNLAGVKTAEFIKYLEPFKERIEELTTEESKKGHIPFILVIKDKWVGGEKAMPLVELKGAKGFIALYPIEIGNFKPIVGVRIPNGLAYLLVDIDTGKGTLNITPDDALPIIHGENRSPLTIDEGIALVTHYPEILKKNNCFSMLGSRCGDRRVAALWISAGKPRLGWCWAGNPHTWLGSASCGSRVGLELPLRTEIAVQP